MDTAEILAALKVSALPADLLTPASWEGLNARETRVLQAAVELGRRALTGPAKVRPRILRAETAASAIAPKLRGLAHEEFWVLLLDARLGLRDMVRVSTGGATQCSVQPREVFRPAILANAAAIITVHNHPSGDPSPSADDQRLWLLVDEAAKALGIRACDHLVIGDGRFYSHVEGSGVLS